MAGMVRQSEKRDETKPTYLKGALINRLEFVSDQLMLFDYSDAVPSLPPLQGFLEIAQESANTIK